MDPGCTGEGLLRDPHKKCRAAFPHTNGALRSFVLIRWERCRDAAGWRNKSARSTVEWDARERWEAKPGGEQVRRGEAAGSGEQR